MTRLGELRESFMEAAERSVGEGAPRSRRRAVSARVVAMAVLLALLLGAGAIAASGVLRTGSPVHAPARLAPTVGLGAPARGGSRVLGVSAADPSGGPRWGLRLVRTTRDLVCVQVGRLYHGRLGVLGIDGAFGGTGSSTRCRRTRSGATPEGCPVRGWASPGATRSRGCRRAGSSPGFRRRRRRGRSGGCPTGCSGAAP